jgi:Holliday junction resolvase RusA-like endonuclease
MKVTFNVLGSPQGKGRPKFSNRGKFVSVRTPDETVLYENLIRTEYRRQCGDVSFADNDMIGLTVIAHYGIPASASKRNRTAMETGEIRPTKKPDADNVLKVVGDSLNGIAYRDDAQVVDALIKKFYSHNPRLEVVMHNIYPE